MRQDLRPIPQKRPSPAEGAGISSLNDAWETLPL